MADPTSFDMAPKPTYRIEWGAVALVFGPWIVIGAVAYWWLH